MLRRLYVWEVPVRLTHWVNAAAIVVLSITGYYIGSPVVGSSGEAYNQHLMATIRAIHMGAAFAFVVSIALRTYWAFAGNEYAKIGGIFPFFSRDGRRTLVEVLRYYLFMRRKPPYILGHNALAGTTYMVIVALYFVQIATGLSLYAQMRPDTVWSTLFGWVVLLLGSQVVRLIHHLVMWLLIAFAIHHVYSAFLMDAEEGNGLLASIFTGFKFVGRNKESAS